MKFNSTEQNIGWFRDRYVEGTLIIKPPFQRKPVWKARQKCSLIESILMGLPVPEIYIQQTVSADDKVQYAIVDGQQRMRAILQFVGSETDTNEAEHNKFALDQLEELSDWHNATFARLTELQRKAFVGHRMAIRFLDTDSDDEIRDLFKRLNRYLTPLKAQELRNAVYTGPFVNVVSKHADDSYWAENRIITPDSIRRMGDVEFVSELFIGLMHGPQGGSSEVIDNYYAQLEDFENEFPGQRRATKLFARSLKVIRRVLPDIKAHRWSNKTDFYSLFVCIGTLLKTQKFQRETVESLRATLLQFAEQVEARMGNDEATVPAEVVTYVAASTRGANDKSRRADRNQALSAIISSHFHSTDKLSGGTSVGSKAAP